MKVLSRRKGAESLLPGAPMRVACVDGGRVAGFGRTGGDGGMETVSFAADARAAAPRSDSIDEKYMLPCVAKSVDLVSSSNKYSATAASDVCQVKLDSSQLNIR